MKTHICKVLLFLFLNLGKFIPYFKRKYMALRKDSILGAINNQINEHFKTYSGLNQFNVGYGIIVVSNMNQHKIQYKIVDPNSVKFNVYLIYENGYVKKTFDVVSESEDSTYINDFFHHFKTNKFDFTELFIALNDTI